MEDDNEFHQWLHRVGTLAKDGDKEARAALWRAFNSLAWPLAKLAQSDPSTIDFDLFQGVLQHSRYMLGRGLASRNRTALTYSHVLAVELCELIEKARKNEATFVSELERRTLTLPILKTKAMQRSTELAYFVWGEIEVYRVLIRRFRKSVRSRDSLSSLTEDNVRVAEANQFRKLLRALPRELNLSSYRKFWRVGKEILKRYWEGNHERRDEDFKILGANPGEKTPLTYAIQKVQKSFKTIAKSLSK